MKKYIIILILGVIFLSTVIITYFLYGSESNEDNVSIEEKSTDAENTENTYYKNEVMETVSEEIKLSYDARLIINKDYNDCGHTITTNVEIPDDMINLTKEEIENEYDTWEIIDFSRETVSLYKEFDGICNEHYIVGIENNYIVIYTLNDDKEKNLYSITDISAEYLPEEDVEELNIGISIEGNKNLNALIENYEN